MSVLLELSAGIVSKSWLHSFGSVSHNCSSLDKHMLGRFVSLAIR